MNELEELRAERDTLRAFALDHQEQFVTWLTERAVAEDRRQQHVVAVFRVLTGEV